MKKLLVLAVISTCAFAGWRVLRGGGGPGAAQDGGGLVLDRIWIDHIPKHDRDQVSVFAAITDEPIGVFQTASAWKGHFELFRYEAHGDEIRIVYPQDNYRERVRTRRSGAARTASTTASSSTARATASSATTRARAGRSTARRGPTRSARAWTPRCSQSDARAHARANCRAGACPGELTRGRLPGRADAPVLARAN